MLATTRQIDRALAAAFERVLAPQLALLDPPGGPVGASGPSGLGRASGYLLGVCEELIESQGFELATSPHFGKLLGHAFAHVYGPAGEQVGLASIEAMRKRNGEVMEGVRAGRQDVAAALAGAFGEPSAFHAFATGQGATPFGESGPNDRS